MRMLRCRECGFSYMLSKIYRWNDDGTITYRLARDFRLLFFYSDLFDELFARIEAELGLPISHIVFEAQRNAAKGAIDAMTSAIPGWVRHNAPAHHFTVRFFCRLSVWMGTSYARVVSYKYGKCGETMLRNPYNRELMAAVVLGAMESMERTPFDHEWKKVGGDDVLRVTVVKEKPEFSERMAVVLEKARPGDRHLPRCPRCGVPRALSSLTWDEHAGTITDTRLGERFNSLEAYGYKAVFRELERELGEDINQLILDAARTYALRHLERLPGIKAVDEAGRAAAWQAFSEEAATMLAAWGHGNLIEITQKGGRAVFTIDNPFEEKLIAGYLAAGYELVEGRACEVTWVSPETGRCVFTISGGLIEETSYAHAQV